MALEGVTFDLQTVGSRDDGSINWAALGGGDCLLEPNMTFNLTSGTSITLSTGHIALGGRVIRVNGAYVFSLTPTVTTGYGRIVARIDLSQPVTEQTFDQLSITEEYVTSEASFAQLTQGFINMPNFSGEYEQELCRFTVADGEATEITSTLNLFYRAQYYGKSQAYSFLGNTGNIAFRRDGNNIVFYGTISGSSAFSNFSNGASVFTELPDVFKPLAAHGGIALARTTNSQATTAYYPCTWQVTTNGAFNIYGNNTDIKKCQYMLLSGSYLGNYSFWINNPGYRG